MSLIHTRCAQLFDLDLIEHNLSNKPEEFKTYQYARCFRNYVFDLLNIIEEKAINLESQPIRFSEKNLIQWLQVYLISPRVSFTNHLMIKPEYDTRQETWQAATDQTAYPEALLSGQNTIGLDLTYLDFLRFCQICASYNDKVVIMYRMNFYVIPDPILLSEMKRSKVESDDHDMPLLFINLMSKETSPCWVLCFEKVNGRNS